MKKLLLSIVIAIFSLSVCFVTACKEFDTANNSSSESSSIEESDSDGFIDRTSGSFEYSSSSDSVNSNNSSSNSISNSGSGIVIPSIDPGDTNTPLGQAIAAINMIGSVTESNYAQKEEYLAYAQSKCDAVSDKSLIPNYTYLEAALSAYKAFAKRGEILNFVADFNNLPEIVTTQNFTVFSDVIDAYDALSTEQKAEIDPSVKTKIEQLRVDVENTPKPATVIDFNTFSNPAGEKLIYFTPTGFTTDEGSGYSVYRNSGSFSISDVYKVTMSGSSVASKGLTVTSVNLTNFTLTIPIERKSKVIIYFSRASGGNDKYLTEVKDFNYTASGVAQSGTARPATSGEVSNQTKYVAVIEQTISKKGSAVFELASSSRVCLFKIIIQLT